MQSPISSFRDVQRMMRNEAGRSVLRQMAERYPYFLPLKAINMLLKEETAALRELPHIYGVNPVVLHYLPYRLREQNAPTEKKQSEKAEQTLETVEETAPEVVAEEKQEVVENQSEISVGNPETPVESQPEIEEKSPEIMGWQSSETPVSAPEALESETPEVAAAESPVEETVVSEAVEEAPVSEYSKEAVPIAEPVEETTPEISAPESQKETASSSPAETPAEEPMIQPLYTKDYFKHQGVSIEENDSASFTLKKASGNDLMVMRSFGEWLRFFHSKKAKADEEQQDKRAVRAMWQKGKLAAALEEEGEEIPEVVFETAVKSISHEGNPATETMARIYLGQGKWEKAIAVYEQLQLRNPQKSAYFAEKIAAIEQQHRP